MSRLQNTANQLEHQMARRAAQKTAKQGEDTSSLLSDLLWEQRQTNKMLWVALTPEQQEAFRALG